MKDEREPIVIEIGVTSRELVKGATMPKLVNQNQKCVVAHNGDTIRWVYPAGITISANVPFNNDKPQETEITGEGTVETVVNGATDDNDKIIIYDIFTSDTDVELDPVIIIKTTPTMS